MPVLDSTELELQFDKEGIYGLLRYPPDPEPRQGLHGESIAR